HRALGALGCRRGTALGGHGVPLLLLRVDPSRQSLGLLLQRLLVGAGEEQVGVLVADPVLGRDLEAQSLATRRVGLLLELSDAVGGLLSLRLLRLLDLSEAAGCVRVLLGALLLLAGLLLPEVHRFGGLRLLCLLLLGGSRGLRSGDLGALLLGH